MNFETLDIDVNDVLDNVYYDETSPSCLRWKGSYRVKETYVSLQFSACSKPAICYYVLTGRQYAKRERKNIPRRSLKNWDSIKSVIGFFTL